MIEIKNLSFRYAGNDMGMLKDVSLSIEKGECVLLCGRSGCGKTSILRLINGLIPDYFDGEFTGTVTYDGKSIPDMEMYERSRLVGSVFQNPRTQFFNVDTDSEIAFGMENLGLDRENMLSRMEDATENLRLESLRGRCIFELSGGEKQRIAFASVYAMNPEVYLLDEPSSNLDAVSIRELKHQLEVIKAQGKTIIISDHRLYCLMDIVDKIVYLENGKIQRIFYPEEFCNLHEEERTNMGLRSTKELELKNISKENSRNIKPAIELKNVTISRGKRILLRNINFSANVGDIVGIVGENGVGKSTFLRTICGLHKDYSGQLILNGVKATKKQLNNICYMVMQDVNYELFAESVKAECSLGLNHVNDEMVEEVLKKLDLNAYKQRHPNTLSGGQKQRLAVGVAKIGQKKLLVFDEPTSGLDYDSMMRIVDLIKEVSSHAVVLVVTHDVEFANTCCTNIVELRKEENNEGKINSFAFKMG